MRRLWRLFLAYTRLDLTAVCEMARSGWDFHTCRDDPSTLPGVGVTYRCERCGREF